MDKGIDSKNWSCYKISWLLRLSPSKEVAMQIIFSNFVNIVKSLANKASEEFNRFSPELKKR